MSFLATRLVRNVQRARDMNKVILLGRLGSKPRYVENPDNENSNYMEISIATNSVKKDAEGNFHQKPEWHNVRIFGRLADSMNKRSLAKGDLVSVEGQLNYNMTEVDGRKIKYTNINVPPYSGSCKLIMRKRMDGEGLPGGMPFDDDERMFAPDIDVSDEDRDSKTKMKNDEGVMGM
eukprot:Nk52_evm29s1129 gene=Nk52_evmTU29s1129